MCSKFYRTKDLQRWFVEQDVQFNPGVLTEIRRQGHNYTVYRHKVEGTSGPLEEVFPQPLDKKIETIRHNEAKYTHWHWIPGDLVVRLDAPNGPESGDLPTPECLALALMRGTHIEIDENGNPVDGDPLGLNKYEYFLIDKNARGVQRLDGGNLECWKCGAISDDWLGKEPDWLDSKIKDGTAVRVRPKFNVRSVPVDFLDGKTFDLYRPDIIGGKTNRWGVHVVNGRQVTMHINTGTESTDYRRPARLALALATGELSVAWAQGAGFVTGEAAKPQPKQQESLSAVLKKQFMQSVLQGVSP